jgi:cold shock protein
MSESFSKKEKAKQKAKLRQDKAQKMIDRKQNATKGKSLEDMMAYVDENGNITNTPPVPGKRKEYTLEEISALGQVNQIDDDTPKTGVVNYYNAEKGFGFIIENGSGEKLFMHKNNMLSDVKENDKVTFETERTVKGNSAVNVKLI